jgi:hypothetical protein
MAPLSVNKHGCFGVRIDVALVRLGFWMFMEVVLDISPLVSELLRMGVPTLLENRAFI